MRKCNKCLVSFTSTRIFLLFLLTNVDKKITKFNIYFVKYKYLLSHNSISIN